MVYTPSIKVKPQVIVDAAVAALEDKLIVSNTVTKRGDAKTFYASQGDTITQRVPGTVPVRTYTPRNDRSQPIRTDSWAETTVNVTISQDRPYSAVKLTDEQMMWDFNGWGPLIDAQIDALGSYLEHGVLTQILNAPFERVILIDDSDTAFAKAKDRNQDNFWNAIVDARSALTRMRTPGGGRLTALIGYDLADALVKSNKLVKVQGTGDTALSSASLGTIGGVTFVPSSHIPADQAYLYDASAFLVYTGVAPVPNSVPFGATASAGGWALRHIVDYDVAYLTDRSVFDTFAGYSLVEDHLKVVDQQGISHIGTEKFFVRGVKLGLKGGTLGTTEKKPGDGSTTTPGGDPNSWLAKVWNQTNITTTIPAGEAYPLGGNFPAPTP